MVCEINTHILLEGLNNMVLATQFTIKNASNFECFYYIKVLKFQKIFICQFENGPHDAGGGRQFFFEKCAKQYFRKSH